MSLTPIFVGLGPLAQAYIRDKQLHRLYSFTGEVGVCAESYEFGIFLEKGESGDILMPFPQADSVWVETQQMDIHSPSTGGEYHIFTALHCVAGRQQGQRLLWRAEDLNFRMPIDTRRKSIVTSRPFVAKVAP